MNTNPGTFPLPFVQPREIKHKLRLQKSASMKGYKLLGLLPTTTQTTKPCRKTSTPVEINMSESIEPLVQLWGQSPELWRRKKRRVFYSLASSLTHAQNEKIMYPVFILLCFGIKVVGNKLWQWETKLALKTRMNKQISSNKTREILGNIWSRSKPQTSQVFDQSPWHFSEY